MPRIRNKNEAGQASAILKLARRGAVLRPKDLEKSGLPRMALMRLVKAGRMQRFGRGLYALAGHELTEHHDLAEVATRHPRAVVCLLSALRFYGFTTQNLFEVWIAVGHKDWRPKGGAPPVRVVHMSGRAAAVGVESHTVEGIPVRVFDAAKTVVDCFRYRNKVGLDVALDALRDFTRRRHENPDILWGYARACRVTRVMRPYLEALS
jgi:predicted transcriptional regulator of viral defense system